MAEGYYCTSQPAVNRNPTANGLRCAVSQAGCPSSCAYGPLTHSFFSNTPTAIPAIAVNPIAMSKVELPPA